MPITITPARSACDLQHLHTLFNLVFELKPDTVASQGTFESLFKKNDACFLLALQRETIVGGLAAYELPLLSGEKEFYIYDIGVHPEYQKQGIGTSLIQELKKQARSRNIATIFVESESADVGAVAFYKSLEAEQIKVEHFNIQVD